MPTRFLVSVLLGMLLACGRPRVTDLGSDAGNGGGSNGFGTQTDGGGGSDAGSDGGVDGGSTATFDPANPGHLMIFQLGAAAVMGKVATFGYAAFQIGAREDYAPFSTAPVAPLGQCLVDPAPTPQCTVNTECSPEQTCVPDTDVNSNPIPGTGKCKTAPQRLDIGPLVITGFVGGPQTFTFNPAKKGAYMLPNPGDGSIPGNVFAYGVRYTFSAAGDAAKGLTTISGEVSMPPAFALTAPASSPGMFGPEVPASSSAGLSLAWSGSDPTGEISITLSGPTKSGGKVIACRTTDNGAFAISAALVQTAGLNVVTFMNTLVLERHRAGTATGQGLTVSQIDAFQQATFFVKQAP